jgi:hypothetical protein
MFGDFIGLSGQKALAQGFRQLHAFLLSFEFIYENGISLQSLYASYCCPVSTKNKSFD